MIPRPRVGISRCLAGDSVRYDGTDRRNDALLRALDHEVEWVPICPEVEVGMGVPREPIQLILGSESIESTANRLRLVGIISREDWTDKMEAWAQERVRGLLTLGLSGFVFKARSPSYGIRDVPVFEAGAETDGRGLFARALMDAVPDLPVVDEDDLSGRIGPEIFLERVRAYRPGLRS
jgi:uncharacterized protein YbbK (DUF523 family)